jgi:hypothetical protein
MLSRRDKGQHHPDALSQWVRPAQRAPGIGWRVSQCLLGLATRRGGLGSHRSRHRHRLRRITPRAEADRGLQGSRLLDAFEGLQTSGSDRVGERLVVPLVLVGVVLGEVGDRPVELVVLAQVGGDRRRVS